MTFWNIFKSFATSDKGQVIHKIDDSTFVSSDGTVYRQKDKLITGSDGSVMTVVDKGGDGDCGAPGLAVTTFSGFSADSEEW